MSARSILEQIGKQDPRYLAIAQRTDEHENVLRDMAIAMDGSIRLAFEL